MSPPRPDFRCLTFPCATPTRPQAKPHLETFFGHAPVPRRRAHEDLATNTALAFALFLALAVALFLALALGGVGPVPGLPMSFADPCPSQTAPPFQQAAPQPVPADGAHVQAPVQTPGRGDWLRQVRDLIAREQPREALNLLGPYLAQHPADGAAQVLAGEAHFALQDWLQAANHFELGVHASPALAGRVFNRGRALLELQRTTEAEAVFAAMRREDSVELRAKGYLGLGFARQEQGDDGAARAAYLETLTLDPDEVRAIYQLGLLDLEGAALADAVQRFERVLTSRPLHHGAAYNLALALTRLGREEPAAAARAQHRSIMATKQRISALRERLVAQPTDGAALLEMGEIHARFGAHREALPWLEQAWRLSGGDPELTITFATSLAAAGHTRTAESLYRALLAREPPVPEARVRLNELLRARGAQEP